MAKQRAHWCLTIPAAIVEQFEPESLATFKAKAGNKDGIPLAYKPDYIYKFIIGSLEAEDDNTKEPHYHCLLSNPKGKASTKGRCTTILGMYGYTLNGPIYIQPLQSKLCHYIDYMFKENTSYKTHSVDHILQDAADHITAKKLNLSKQNFFNYLLQERGAHWCTKNKPVIDTFTSNTLLFDNKRIIVNPVNNDEIARRACAMIQAFQKTVYNNLKDRDRRFVLTEHQDCQHILIHATDMSKFITILTLIPYLFQRSQEVDNLPSLYFYGEPSSGKSYMFQAGKAYKYIASDANGVGRFKLDGTESALLFDDIKSKTIDQENNMSLLRTLTIGGTGRVKVHSDTKLITAFIVCTSNDEPHFLDKGPTYIKETPYGNKPELMDDFIPKWDNQQMAWQRRFIAVHFLKKNFEDFLVSSGNEFDYTAGQEVAARFILQFAFDIQHFGPTLTRNENTRNIGGLLKIYTDACKKYTDYVPKHFVNPEDICIKTNTKKRGLSDFVTESDEEEENNEVFKKPKLVDPKFDEEAFAR